MSTDFILNQFSQTHRFCNMGTINDGGISHTPEASSEDVLSARHPLVIRLSSTHSWLDYLGQGDQMRL
jgi:hypothetical protein